MPAGYPQADSLQSNSSQQAIIRPIGPLLAAVVFVPTSRKLTFNDSGKVLELGASVTLQIDEGALQSDFRCVLMPNVQVSIEPLGGTLLNDAAATLVRDAVDNTFVSICARQSVADSYVVDGVAP